MAAKGARRQQSVLEVSVRPRSPFRLPGGGMDGVMRAGGGAIARLLHVDGSPVVVCAWTRPDREIGLRAEAVDPARVEPEGCAPARPEQLEKALERMRFAIGVDDDLSGFHRAFERDPVLGPAIRSQPWARISHRPWPWEALAWAITAQLIEAVRAAEIQRRMVYRLGSSHTPVGRQTRLWDVPDARTVFDTAPAELVRMDLAPKRALAMIRVAHEVADGRIDLMDPDHDKRLLAIPEIGPWTVQCLGSAGRGDFDSLPAGDLAYVKVVGHLTGMGRRAMVPEVEEYYARFEPYRALAGIYTLRHYGRQLKQAPPLKYVPAWPEADAA